MRSVWPIFIIDFNCRPKILKEVVLERRVPQNRIAEGSNDGPRLWSRSAIGRRTKIGVNRDLDADRRLNIEVTPAFAPRQGGLRNQDIVRDAGPVTTWNGHLEEAGHNVVAVFLVGGNETVLRKEGRPISRRGLGAPRPGGRDNRRCRDNNFGVVCWDKFNSWAAGATVAQQALAVTLRARSIFLVIK